MSNFQVIMKKKNYGFAPVPKSLIFMKNVNPISIGIFSYLSACPDNYKFSIPKITAHFSSGREAIAKAIKFLEEHRYLERVKSQDEKGHWLIDYELNYDPEKEIPDYGNPYEGKPYDNIETFINKEKKTISNDIVKESAVEKDSDMFSLASPPASSNTLALSEILQTDLAKLSKRVGPKVADMILSQIYEFKSLTEEQREIVIAQYERKHKLKYPTKTIGLTELKAVKKWPIEVMRCIAEQAEARGWQSLWQPEYAERCAANIKRRQESQPEEKPEIKIEKAESLVIAFNNAKASLKTLTSEVVLNKASELYSNISATSLQGIMKHMAASEGEAWLKNNRDRLNNIYLEFLNHESK